MRAAAAHRAAPYLHYRLPVARYCCPPAELITAACVALDTNGASLIHFCHGKEETTHGYAPCARVSNRFVSSLLLLIPALGLADTEVTTCGQHAGGRGYLSSDLDCTGAAVDHAVTIDGYMSSLDLRGFTITGGKLAAVNCTESCKIIGPGTITGSDGNGISGSFAGGFIESVVKVSNITISGNAGNGLWSYEGVQLTDSTITANGGNGILVQGPARVTGSLISGNGLDGISLVWPGLTMEDSTVSDNGLSGISSAAGRLRLKNSQVTNNAKWGIDAAGGWQLKDCLVHGNGSGGIFGLAHYGSRFRLINSTVSNNGDFGVIAHTGITLKDSVISDNLGMGVSAWGKTLLVRCTITGNGGAGVALGGSIAGHPSRCKDSVISGNRIGLKSVVRISGCTITNNELVGVLCGRYTCSERIRMKIKDADITGNGTDPACGVTEVCADIDSWNAPVLRHGTTCDTSHVTDSGIPGTNWGICALD